MHVSNESPGIRSQSAKYAFTHTSESPNGGIDSLKNTPQLHELTLLAYDDILLVVLKKSFSSP